MNKIIIAYRNRDNMAAINNLEGVINNVFGNYIEAVNCYVDELREEDILVADAFVVIDRSIIPLLKKHAPYFKNVVLMTRSIKKKYLESIMAIPKDADVLIVNDTLESSDEMVYMFYELGIDHIDFIAFDAKKNDSGAYDDIDYAITPNEVRMVPKHIKNIINIGYREIGFDTMVQLMNMLSLNNETVTLNLIKYISTIVEPMQDFQISYVNSYLKGHMLNEYVYDSPSAIFVVDEDDRLVYSNREANDIFSFDAANSPDIKDCLSDKLALLLRTNPEMSRYIVQVDDTNYALDKRLISLSGQVLGYFVTMQNEIDIKNIETSFNKRLREKGYYARHKFCDIVHISSSMDEVIAMARKAAGSEYTILITGESGTGKELIAQSIHNDSPRRAGPFIGVNCAALTETLLESELFGYESGAFTGAKKGGKPGYFEQANKGTLFLDEIGDISPGLQARLLRVIQERQIMRIGSDKIINIDVRIITATNKNLLEEVKLGDFRADLYYRLNALQLTIPPLRERKEDVAVLFDKFMGRSGSRISREERHKMEMYDWPGNVRELENCAVYYKTMGNLPSQFDLINMTIKNIDVSTDKIDDVILRLLEKYSTPSHGVGRTRLQQLMKDHGIQVSDVYLRHVLIKLQNESLITVGKGRQGASLTEKGRTCLAM